MKPELDPLAQLAQLEGVALSYVTAAGKKQNTAPEALAGVLGALGSPAASFAEIQDSLRLARQRPWRRGLEPVTVLWEGQPAEIRVRLPSRRARKRMEARLFLENGEGHRWDFRLDQLHASESAEIKGERFSAAKLALPHIPLGYHRFELETAEGVFRSLLIGAPLRSYSGAGSAEPALPGTPGDSSGAPRSSKRWGVFLPMYALHSRRSWGAGNFSDWLNLSEWVSSQGGTIAGTLPLLATFLDRPVCEPSPYAPVSRLFWNEFYLDIEQAPEFSSCQQARELVASPAFQEELAAFRGSDQVDYAREMAARRRVLEILAAHFFAHASPRHRPFRRFLRERPELEDYARFRAACDGIGVSWHNWPERMRQGRLRSNDYPEAAKEYHLYVQWLAQEQINALLEKCRARAISLYLDLPLGVHPDGYDMWREREAFALGANAGAPPDPFFSKGQNWGFAPMHPRQIREQGYRYVLDFLRFQMRHTGLLRIDHVMGLHRLYWIPRGLPATQGAYVRYPAEELYAILCLESHRHRTVLVGENLGTVPPEVNQGLKRHHIRQMYVLQYEQRPAPTEALRRPPARSVASLNTHDMPPFASHWRALDLADHAGLGLIPRGELGQQRELRRELGRALVEFLAEQGRLKHRNPNAAAVMQACFEWLSASPAEIVLVNLEDLWLEEAPQNVPGTHHQRPNWRRKARLGLEEILRSEQLSAILRRIDQLRS